MEDGIAKQAIDRIWIADLGGAKMSDILSEFRKLGCNTSTLKELKHAAIDVPLKYSEKN